MPIAERLEVLSRDADRIYDLQEVQQSEMEEFEASISHPTSGIDQSAGKSSGMEIDEIDESAVPVCSRSSHISSATALFISTMLVFYGLL